MTRPKEGGRNGFMRQDPERTRRTNYLPPTQLRQSGPRGCNSGRARVPARREQVYVINLVKRWIWSVLGVGKADREDAIPPGRRSSCVARTKKRSPLWGPPERWTCPGVKTPGWVL